MLTNAKHLKNAVCFEDDALSLHVPRNQSRGISDFYVLRKNPKISEWISECNHGKHKLEIFKIFLTAEIMQTVKLKSKMGRMTEHFDNGGIDLYGCNLARILNISMTCLCSHMLEGSLKMYIHSLEPKVFSLFYKNQIFP